MHKTIDTVTNNRVKNVIKIIRATMQEVSHLFIIMSKFHLKTWTYVVYINLYIIFI